MGKSERKTPETSQEPLQQAAASAPPAEQAPAEQSGSADPTPAPPENPVNDTPISFAEPETQQTALIEDDNSPVEKAEASHGLTDEQFYKLHQEAVAENEKADFRARILAARNAKPAPEPVKPPIAERVAEQTKAEMAAGKKLVEQRAAEQAMRSGMPRPAPDKGEGTTTEVFRPANYVPDVKKGQGNVQARNL